MVFQILGIRAVSYRARIFGNNPLYGILNDHWQNFAAAYEERFEQTCGGLRRTATRVVNRFLDCGNPMNGFARIKCSGCGSERLLHFSCKTRGFCPSCQARHSEEWARWIADELSEPVHHRQIVFTIPKILRAYFHYDRKLLTELSRAAHRAVSRFVESTCGAGVRPAIVVVTHTFGEGARFHPHLHALVTSGGWNASRVWHPVPMWDQGVLRELFEIEVFRFLRRGDLLGRERMELIRSWPHSGFNVHVGDAVAPDDKTSLVRIARYMLRAQGSCSLGPTRL
jgi:ribosomal protein S27E